VKTPWAARLIDLTSKALLGCPSGSVHGAELLLELLDLRLLLELGGVLELEDPVDTRDELLLNDGALELLNVLLPGDPLLLD
jgi:hypothetical protein